MMRLFFVLILAAASALAQPITTFSFDLSSIGDGWGFVGDQDSHAVAGALIVSGNNTQTAVPFNYLALHGDRNSTTIIVILSNPTGDVLSFLDTSPSLNSSPGRTGTATLRYGTGAFHFATGSMQYTFACTVFCGSAGGLLAGAFEFTLSGHGSFTLPTQVAQYSLPTVTPPPPATGISRIINGIITKMGVTPPSQTGNIVSAHAASAAAVADKYQIIPPWQFAPTTYNASATCPNLPTSCWITIPAPTGSIPPFTSTPIEADLSGTNLGAGVYPANIGITLTATGATPTVENVPAMLIVTNGNPLLELSEAAIPFQTVAGSTTVMTHTISAVSSGSPISYTATASTLTGGSWLSVTQTTSSIVFFANPAGLAAGSYFGKVDVSAPTSLTPVQSIPVTLTVVASPPTAPSFSTTGLIFVAPQGSSPASQSVTVSTFSSGALQFTAGAAADNNGSWLSAVASTTTITSGKPVTETVSVNSKNLLPGVYTGNAFTELSGVGPQYPIKVVLVITPTSGACTPAKVLPVLTSLIDNFELPAGVPVSIAANVVDDCGVPLTSGSVAAFFGAGDSTAILQAMGGGTWQGTWAPHAVAGGPASVSISAESVAGLLGSTSVNGTLDANATATVVNAGGIVNAASLVSGAPISPGQFLSLFGTNLATATSVSPSYPYATSLAGTQVFLNGQALPLEFVSSGQINALVPYGTPVNSFQELLVQQNGIYSLPETLVVSAANPAVFTQSQSGTGAGVIVVVKPNGTQFEASASHPASAGDALVIYCTGLGAVSPLIADGAAASLTTLSYTVNPVTVTVGGMTAQVLFAGLAPGYAGLYQVNAIVPAAVVSGTSVPVVVTGAGFPSAPVTVSIQ